ncbi:MAG: benzoate/H(+) symporter BenE family transporter [Pseudomonadota bacterium]
MIPAFVAAIQSAFSDTDQFKAPALTFLITESGMVLFGISGAVWGVVADVSVWEVRSWKNVS